MCNQEESENGEESEPLGLGLRLGEEISRAILEGCYELRH